MRLLSDLVLLRPAPVADFATPGGIVLPTNPDSPRAVVVAAYPGSELGPGMTVLYDVRRVIDANLPDRDSFLVHEADISTVLIEESS